MVYRVIVLNDPINFVDPEGLITWQGLGGTIAMGAGGALITLTSPAWASTAGVVLVVGGATLTIYDWYSSMEWAEKTGKDLGEDLQKLIEERLREIERQTEPDGMCK